MRIGYDGKRALNNLTGLGNYSRLVIEEMGCHYPLNQIYLYVPKMRENPRMERIEAMHNVEFRLPPPQGFSGSLWRTWGIPNNLRADKIDIYHGLSNELPLNIRKSGVKSVVTIHDLIYRRFPEYYKLIDRKLYDFKYGASCRNSDLVIAISECTKRDIIEYYDVPEDKVEVIYQGCDQSFREKRGKENLDDVRKRLNLPDCYLLQVGTIEHRKNLIASVRALRNLPSYVKLVVVGKDHHGYLKEVKREISACGLDDRVVFRHGVSFQDLPAVYQMAEVVLYPSRYEGFGIPVLEALESERPVIAATGSCLEEAGGDGAYYVSPDDHGGMSDIISEIMRGGSDVADHIKKGKHHASRFNTENMVLALNKTYERLLLM